jgi:hypothetical protein
MRKVIVNEFMSLDGVVQAPGAADEDTTGGFKHGGWHLRYLEDLSQQRIPGGHRRRGRVPARAPHLRDLRRLLAEGSRGGTGDR